MSADILSATGAFLNQHVVRPAIHLASVVNSSDDDADSVSSASGSVDSATQQVKTKQFRTLPPKLHEIRVLMQLWRANVVAGDTDAVLNRYSPSAVLIPLDSDVPIVGHGAIRNYYEGFLPHYKPSSIKVLYGKVALPGSENPEENNINNSEPQCWAQDNGIYDLTTHSGQLVRARYTFVYVRDNNGRWRIVHHSSSKICSIDKEPESQPESSVALENDEANISEESKQSQSPAAPSHVDVNLLCALEGFSARGGSGGSHHRVAHPSSLYPTPQRRASQLDHLVGMMTGTKPVTQNDLILLSLSHKQQTTAKKTHNTNPSASPSEPLLLFHNNNHGSPRQQ